MNTALIVVCTLLLLSAIISATPTVPECTLVAEPQQYEKIIVSSDIIQRLNEEFSLANMQVYDCPNRGIVISAEYYLPKSYSSLDVVYRSSLKLLYVDNNLIIIDANNKNRHPSYALAKEILLDDELIQQVESNQEVQNFLLSNNEKMAHLNANPFSVFIRSGNEVIMYSVKSNVITYLDQPTTEKVLVLFEVHNATILRIQSMQNNDVGDHQNKAEINMTFIISLIVGTVLGIIGLFFLLKRRK